MRDVLKWDGVASSVCITIFLHGLLRNLGYWSGSIYMGETCLRSVPIRVYAEILTYLAQAKAYFQKNTLRRHLGSAFETHDDFRKQLTSIEKGEDEVDRYTNLLDARHRAVATEGQVEMHDNLKQMLASIDGPIQRMAIDISNIKDQLEDSERTKILDWISPLPYQGYHNHHKRDILQGTGQWLYLPLCPRTQGAGSIAMSHQKS
uniref:Uncharacterized protein n=1 Tax=Moniliophthora roreri TaxID=221103 RepID=A0A0W0GEH4_MONRR